MSTAEIEQPSAPTSVKPEKNDVAASSAWLPAAVALRRALASRRGKPVQVRQIIAMVKTVLRFMFEPYVWQRR
jgi:hypothetical protein